VRRISLPSVSWLALLFFASLEAGLSETVVLLPIADTTLIETVPTNNLGGAPFVNSGATQNRPRTRGLFKFDPASQIPARSKIKTVSLAVYVTLQPRDGFEPSCFDLHRVLQPWGEGNKVAVDPRSPGLGAPATTNEATWLHRFAFTTNTWTAPGGAATNDYTPAVSSSQAVYDVGNSPYVFGSTPQFIADVQTWLDDPGANFGWILISEGEDTPFTARRFGSREDTNNAPLLTIEFIAPPRLERPQISATNFTFQFTAEAGQPYAVEFAASLPAAPWLLLTNLPSPTIATNLTVRDLLSPPRRFYRIGAR
jgi:hypothetical protein